MELGMRNLVSYGVLAPPTIFILLCLIGSLVAVVWRRIGILITLVSSICLFITATPVFSTFLTTYVETRISKDMNVSSAEAIVVLGVDVRKGNGPDRLGFRSLDNLKMAVDAYRQLGLPVAVTGGRVSDWDTSVAALMKAALVGYFGVPVSWTEDQSRTTHENAVYTSQPLRKANIGTIVLVAQAVDLPRAIVAFEQAGMRALPWSAPLGRWGADRLQDFLPSTAALHESFYALHELIGDFYYRVRY